MKIWAKTIYEDKITRDSVYERAGKPSQRLFEECLREACESMDIPCPVMLKSHYQNFMNYNITKFLSRDFVESIDFESFVVENIPDDK